MTTPNIVPRADGEGSLGTVSKQWLDVQAKTINGKSLVTTATADSIPITDATGKLDTSLLPTHSHAQSDITNLITALAAKADTTHNHSGTYIESTRSVSAGAGLSGGGALSADRTISMGTPSSCSTTTPNSASGTTHTHTITGVAASSHTHNYAPIPTSSSLPVGFACLCTYENGNNHINNGATITGSDLSIYIVETSTNHGGKLSGTWKNISGATITRKSGSTYNAGLFVRIA